MNKTKKRLAVVGCAVLMVATGMAIPAEANATADARAIKNLIAK